MACLLVPAAEAVVTTVIKKKTDKTADRAKTEIKKTFVKKLSWLINMLWGGSVLLALEHVWHGESTPWFPFLTNAANLVDASVMLRELATWGVGMTLLVTAVWAVVVAVTNAIEKWPASVEVALDGGEQS